MSDNETPLIPREVLFGNPEKVDARIAPDGSLMAYRAPRDGVMNLWVRSADSADDRPVTDDRGRGIQAYCWSADGSRLLYVQDKDGDENWHVYSVGARGGPARDLTPLDGVQARIVAVERSEPGAALLGINDRDPSLHDVHRVDLGTGARTLDTKNGIGATAWVADHGLRVRAAVVPTPDGGFTLKRRRGPDADWEDALAWGPEDALTSSPAGYAGDDRTLYLVTSAGSDTAELRALDPESGAEKVLASDPEADLCGVLSHPATHEPQAAAFNTDRVHWRALDSSVEADLRALAGLHPGDFEVTSRDDADRTWIVQFSHDKGAAAYYAYDRASREGSFLFSARPQLDGLPLAGMRPVRFKARDGLDIRGYLTLPVGTEPSGLPAVVMVHGGPWWRDSWGFNGAVQWLANRGYAVLQVNFRGSTGFGKRFVNAGDREWGGRMQDDVTDGVRWLVERGVADPKRVAIYGGSYGGFAALSGVTGTPGLYAAAVDIVGPSNLLTFLRSLPPYWKPLEALIFRRVGHPEADEGFLKGRSPISHIGELRTPLLIAQGANDPRVPRAESLQVVSALKAAGKTVEYMEFADEGHGFVRPENRLAFHAAAERFLARHLGGRFDPG